MDSVHFPLKTIVWYKARRYLSLKSIIKVIDEQIFFWFWPFFPEHTFSRNTNVRVPNLPGMRAKISRGLAPFCLFDSPKVSNICWMAWSQIKLFLRPHNFIKQGKGPAILVTEAKSYKYSMRQAECFFVGIGYRRPWWKNIVSFPLHQKVVLPGKSQTVDGPLQ